ncbi:spirocyclase AveC family protein [Nonomuraea turkmeniaca]|nr:spirocyclase AveC family protein [Nonomuraea turkmeniaca]
MAIAFQLWIFARWVADGGAHAVPHYGYEISTVRAVITVVVQVVIGAVALLTAVVLIRRSRAVGRVTFDTAMYFGFFLGFWQDPLFNYHRIALTVTHFGANVTTWGPYIPGWHSPHPELQAETLLTVSCVAYFMLMFWVWPQAALTMRIARRRPHWRWVRLVAVSVLIGVCVDIVLEAIWLSTGVFSYAAPVPKLTVFEGHWYGFPLTQPVGAAILITPVVMMRHVSQIHATEPWLFRGVDMFATAWGNILRLLAGIGLANVLLLAYMVFSGLVNLTGGPIPADTPSYLWPSQP